MSQGNGKAVKKQLAARLKRLLDTVKEGDPALALQETCKLFDHAVDGECEEVVQEWVVDEVAPSVTKELMKRKDDVEEEEELEFFAAYIDRFFKFFVDVCSVGRDSIPLLEAVSVVLDGHANLYLQCEQLCRELDRAPDGPLATSKSARQEVGLYIENLNAFHAGFDCLLKRLADLGESRPALSAVHWMVYIFARTIPHLTPEFRHRFGESLRALSFALMDSLKEEQLQHEAKKTVSGILDQLDVALLAGLGAPYREAMERFRLSFASKLLRMGLLDKRLLALQLLHDMLELAQTAARKESAGIVVKPHEQWITPPMFAQWFEEDGTVEYLYGKGAHAELLSRCSEIPILLAEHDLLTEAHLDVIWKASVGQHESIVVEVYKAVGALANFLSPDLLSYVQQKMDAIRCADYDANFLNVVRTFTFGAVSHLDALQAAAGSGPRPWFGLDLLWKFIQDGSGAPSADLEGMAQGLLADCFRYPVFFSQRPIFMERCVKQIEQGVSVPQACGLLSSILLTYPSGTQEDQMTFVISWLQQRYGLLELIVQDMYRYQTLARNTHRARLASDGSSSSSSSSNNNNNNTAVDPNLQVFRGSRVHHMVVRARKDFLAFVLVRAPIQLTQTQLDLCWECLIVAALSEWERAETFTWWRESFRPPSADAPYPLWTPESSAYVFSKFSQLPMDLFSPTAFACFRSFFMQCNSDAQHLLIQGENRILVRSPNIFGTEMLWKIALSAPQDEVARDASALLVLLQKNVESSMVATLGQFRRAFVDQCLQHLNEALLSDKSSNNNSNNNTALVSKVERCTRALKTFLTELKGRIVDPNVPAFQVKIALVAQPAKPFSLDVFPHTTIGEVTRRVAKALECEPRLLRVISAGQELKFESDTLAERKITAGSTLHYIARADTALGTRRGGAGQQSASAPQPSAAVLTDPTLSPAHILSNAPYFGQLFSLLEFKDPKVGALVWELIMLIPYNAEILQRLSTLDGGNPNWNELLHPTSTYKLFYALIIIESLIAADEESDEHRDWLQSFLLRGGLEHLGQILVNKEFSSPIALQCLQTMLKIVVRFCVEPSDKKDVPSVLRVDVCRRLLSLDTLLQRLYGLVESIAQQRPTTSEAVDCCTGALNLFVPLVCVIPDGYLMLFNAPHFASWLQATLLKCESAAVRTQVGEALHVIVTAAGAPAIKALLERLLAMLDWAHESPSSSAQYFVLTDQMLALACTRDNAHHFEKLARSLCGRIMDRAPLEARFTKKDDQVLQGYMKLCTALLLQNTALAAAVAADPPDGSGLMSHVFRECLFDIPTLDDHGELAPPKCKRRATRRAALALLAVLGTSSGANFEELTTKLLEHHKDGHRRASWQYQPSQFEKDPCGYVGLKNLGATCYMNSFMQNLYMHAEFRRAIFQCDPLAAGGDPDLAKNTLYQLQSFYGHLQESELRSFDTRPFVECYPLNPLMQQDVDEFMNLAFDKIEGLVKGTAFDKLPAKFFGGSQISQVISRECSHVSENEEPFSALSVEVKGKRNMAEALLAYIQGDMLTGDNKYHCGQCDAKVDAMRRVCVGRLPDTLLVSLKRFAFNFETLNREKVNSYFEFPHEIDLWEYSRAGLAEAEGTQLQDDPAKQPIPRDRDYFKFRLTGIVVHTGTTETGHYYSFVKERVPLQAGRELRWISFNDSNVEEYDPNLIPADCFGGVHEESRSRVDPKTNLPLPPEEKMHSAYMLFYERVGVVHDPNYAVTAQANVPRPVLEQVWEANGAFARDRAIFSEDYFAFVWGLVASRADAEPVADGKLQANDAVFHAIQLGTSFLFETLSHAKEKFHFQQWVTELTAMYRKHIPACRWLLAKLSEVRECAWITSAFLVCTQKSTRELLADLVIAVMETVSALPTEAENYLDEHDQASAERCADLELPVVENPAWEQIPSVNYMQALGQVPRFIDALASETEKARSYWKNFGEFWKLFHGFVSIGARERRFFVERHYVSLLVDCYLGDQSPLSKKYFNKTTRKRMQTKAAKPDTEMLFATISLVACHSQSAGKPDDAATAEYAFATMDQAMVTNPQLWKWAMSDGTGAVELAKLAEWVCWGKQDRSQMIDHCIDVMNDLDYTDLDCAMRVCLAVLAIPDTLAEERAARFLGAYLRMVEGNAKYRSFTTRCVQFFAQACEAVPCVREEAFRSRARWLKRYLILSDSRDCRAAAELAFKALSGERGATEKEEFVVALTKEGLLVLQAPADVSPDVFRVQMHRVQDLFETLWEMMPTLQDYLQVDRKIVVSQADAKVYGDMWLLTSYFRCLLWCVRGPTQIETFVENFDTFRAMSNALETTRNEADLNRKEMIRFWHKCFGYRDVEGTYVAFESSRNLILADESLCAHFIDFFVSLRASPRYIEYNNTSLVPFYEMLLVLLQDQNFVTIMANHRNYDWSVQFLWLETTQYPSVAPLIKSVVKTLCASGATYRQRMLQWIVTLPIIDTHYQRVLVFLDWLVTDQADAVMFCRAGGLEYMSKFFSLVPQFVARAQRESLVAAGGPPGVIASKEKGGTTAQAAAGGAAGAATTTGSSSTSTKIEPFVGRALRILQRSIKWMVQDLDSPARDIRLASVEQWDSKTNMVQWLLQACLMFQGKPEITSCCYAGLQIMASVDKSCRHVLLRILNDFHIQFWGQALPRLPHHMAIANPHQAEHTLNLNKLHEYYTMVREVIAKLVDEEQGEPWDDAATYACNVCMLISMECPLTLGHLCDSFFGALCSFSERNPNLFESRFFLPLMRHLLSDTSSPKLTQSNTLRFARISISSFAAQLSPTEIANLTGWCSGMIVAWLSTSENAAASVAISLIAVCIKDPAFAQPLLANPLIAEKLQVLLGDLGSKPLETRAIWMEVKNFFEKKQ